MDATGRRRALRRLILLVPAVLFVAVVAAAVVRGEGRAAPGSPAPEFSGRLLGGGSLALADLRGKPVVLNFWASWCLPCRDEAPLLRRAHEAYGDRVAFIGINIRDARSDAASFARRHRLDWPHVRDESLQIYDDYGLTGQPETYFIDRRGIVVAHVPGPLFEGDVAMLVERTLEAR